MKCCLPPGPNMRVSGRQPGSWNKSFAPPDHASSLPSFARRDRVGAREQVAQRPSPAQRQPDPPPMLGPVVQQVAPLAECPDVAVPAPAMGRVMVEMRRRQHDLGRATGASSGRAGEGTLRPRPSRQACCSSSHQRPSPRWRTILAMRPATDLAAALGAHEPDPVADLRPVDRVEVAQLRLDRHGRVPAQASRAAVRARGRWR